MNYSMTAWLWLFFIYCFLGWLWETVYVSFRMKKLVKRGFLYGPWLPIYGFGAVLILYITGPFQDKWYIVYFLGVISATLLEGFTGALMESLFHMRYWDYSQESFNYKGYICLKVSLFWGVFALLVTEWLNPQIEGILMIVSEMEYLLASLAILFSADVVLSVKKAFNIASFMSLSIDIEKMMTNAETSVRNFAEDLRIKIKSADQNEEVIEPDFRKKTAWPDRINRFEDRRINHLNNLIGYTDELLTEIDKQIRSNTLPERSSRLNAMCHSIGDFRASLYRAMNEIELNRGKQIKRIAHLLETYPTFTSQKYHDILTKIQKNKDR